MELPPNDAPRALRVVQLRDLDLGLSCPVRLGGRPRGIVVHRAELPAPRLRPQASPPAPAAVPAPGRARAQAAAPVRSPFAIYIAADGAVAQAVALDRTVPHASPGHGAYIGVGCIGDFRGGSGRDASLAQLAALVGVCAHLAQCGLVDPDAPDFVIAHDPDDFGATAPPTHGPGGCPGPRLPVARVAMLARAQLAAGVVGLDLLVSAAAGLRTGHLADPTLLAARLRRSEAALWAGRLDAAQRDLEGLLAVTARPEPMARALLLLAQVGQYRGAHARACGALEAAGTTRDAAHEHLRRAAAAAERVADAAACRRLAAAVAVQALVAERVAQGHAITPALMERYQALAAALRAAGPLPPGPAFVDALAGRHSAAAAAAGPDALVAGSPAVAAALCELGRDELDAAQQAAGARHLAMGLAAAVPLAGREGFLRLLRRPPRPAAGGAGDPSRPGRTTTASRECRPRG